jgi:hypothetical protein
MSETKDKSKGNSALSKVDIYGQKVELKYKGKSSYTSAAGGVLYMLSILLFGTCMYAKLNEFNG